MYVVDIMLFCYLKSKWIFFCKLGFKCFFYKNMTQTMISWLGTWGNESFATMLPGLANSIFFLDMDWTKLVIRVIKQLQALQNVAFLEGSPYYYEWLGLVVDLFFFVLGNNKPCKRGIFISFFPFFFGSFFLSFSYIYFVFFFFLNYW